MFDSLCDFCVFVKTTMPDPLYGRTTLSQRIRYFFIWTFVKPMLGARTVNGVTGVIFGPREHPNILGNKAALVDILRKQGNGPNFRGSECGNLENTFGTIRPL